MAEEPKMIQIPAELRNAWRIRNANLHFHEFGTGAYAEWLAALKRKKDRIDEEARHRLEDKR